MNEKFKINIEKSTENRIDNKAVESIKEPNDEMLNSYLNKNISLDAIIEKEIFGNLK